MVTLKRSYKPSKHQQTIASAKKVKTLQPEVSSSSNQHIGVAAEMFRSQNLLVQNVLSEQSKLLASMSMPTVAQHVSAEPPAKLCKAFQRGFCKFGQSCYFPHEQRRDSSKVASNGKHYRCKCGLPAAWRCATWSCKDCCLNKPKRCEFHKGQKAGTKVFKFLCGGCGAEASPHCTHAATLQRRLPTAGKRCQACCPGCSYHKAGTKAARFVCGGCGKAASPHCKHGSGKRCQVCCPGCSHHKAKEEAAEEDCDEENVDEEDCGNWRETRARAASRDVPAVHQALAADR